MNIVPQIIMIVLFAMNIAITATKHGEPKTGTYDFGAAIMRLIVWVPLLYFGGFWAPLFH
jgi:hypothetical protein